MSRGAFAMLLVVALPACGPDEPAPVCVTECGFRVRHLAGGWTCHDVERTERAVRDAFLLTTDPRVRNVCSNISGATMGMVDQDPFYSPLAGTDVHGVTNCDFATTAISNLPPNASALAHEMAHLAQRCIPSLDCEKTAEDSAHACWDSQGINAAVELARHSL